jgi:hypothetical protein
MGQECLVPFSRLAEIGISNLVLELARVDASRARRRERLAHRREKRLGGKERAAEELHFRVSALQGMTQGN